MEIRAAVLDRMEAPRPYAQSRPLSVETVNLAGPGWNEVLVRITGAGLCHSDLSIINGDRPRPLPMVLGHEAAGIVEELGPGVSDLVRGDAVALVFVPSCGHCLPCLEGRLRGAHRCWCRDQLGADPAGAERRGGRPGWRRAVRRARRTGGRRQRTPSTCRPSIWLSRSAR